MGASAQKKIEGDEKGKTSGDGVYNATDAFGAIDLAMPAEQRGEQPAAVGTVGGEEVDQCQPEMNGGAEAEGSQPYE